MTLNNIINIFDYIKQLSNDHIALLYGQSNTNIQFTQWVCRAIFQSLTSLSRTYIMRIIFIDHEISIDLLTKWCHENELTIHQNAMNELQLMRILIPSKNPNYFIMHEGFRKSLRCSLTNVSKPWNAVSDVKGENVEALDAASLDDMCIRKWNDILEYLVTSNPALNISSTVENFLIQAGLMQVASDEVVLSGPRKGRPKTVCITSKGYEYMLMDIQSQVWMFAFECLKRSGSRQAEVLSFLLTLSYCEVGMRYPTSSLTPIQRQLMIEFSHLGILYQNPKDSSGFYPTRIAISMVFRNAARGVAQGRTQIASGGSITGLSVIVETNFQVVAYVTSDLHLAMLSLFVDTRGMIRMPNMALGIITRDSVKSALKMGISAKQIIGFLTLHAHPRVANKTQIVPENVADQLLLWEAEKHRLHTQEAVYLNLSLVVAGKDLEIMYTKILAYAEEIGVCLFANENKKCLVVTPEGYRQLQAYASSIA